VLRLRRLVAAAVVVLIVLSVLQLRSAHVDVLPEFLPPTVDVQTEALGLSAVEVEQLITVPLEQDLLNGVAWLDTIQSESVPGLSSIHLTFDSGTDLYKARQLVQERLSQSAGLPNVSKPPQMLQPTSSTGRVMMIGLSSKSMSLMQMSVLARWTIAPRLMGVPGVANVATWGQRDLQLQVQVDPERLRENNVTLLDIIKTTGNALWYSPLTFLEASTPGTGGFIDTSNQRLTVMHLLPISTPEELAQVAIDRSGDGATTESGTATTGSALPLGAVADIVEDHQPLIGDAVLTNGPGLLLVIDKLPGADVYQVTKGVQVAMQELQPGLSDIQIDYTVFRPATYIEHGLSNLALGLIIGGVLILLTLAVFLFDWRSVLIGAVVIALGLAVAELILRLMGVTFNWMTLAGLVIGLTLVIDVAMSIVGNIRRRLRERGDTEDRASAIAVALDAIREMRGVAVYTMVIVLVGLLPVLSARGTTGVLVHSLSLPFALAVAASTAAALAVTPALVLLLLPKGSAGRRESSPIRWLKRGYQRCLVWMIRPPLRSYLPAVVIMVIAIGMLPLLKASLEPAFKDTNVLVQFDAQPGTSLSEMTRIVNLASAELKALPGVKEVGGHVGRAVLGDQVVNVNSSVLWLNIDGIEDYAKTLAAIREVAEGYPGLDGEVLTYPNSRLADAALGPKNELTVRIYGQDLDTLSSKAAEVSKMVSSIEGVAAVDVENFQQEPGLNIEVNLSAAQRYGIKPGDVRRAAAALLSGMQVGSLFEEEKVFDVVVWGTPEIRTDLNSIRNLLIDTPSGDSVKLSDVADVSISPNPTVVRHYGVSRKIDVTVDVVGRNPGSVAEDIETRLAPVSLPFEYHMEVLGTYDEVEAIQGWMLALGAVTVLGIFLLLQSSLGSWRLALLCFLSSLAAVTGGVAAAFFMNRAISPAVLLGLLAVFGIAVRSSTLLVHDCRKIEREQSERADAVGERIAPLGLVLQSAGGRFDSMFTTIIAVGLALLPLAILGDVAGLEVLHEPVVAILCSLVSLAFVTLFVAPALYLRFGHSWRKQDATT
jgi:Cu/Ag efflux pump CusA